MTVPETREESGDRPSAARRTRSAWRLVALVVAGLVFGSAIYGYVRHRASARAAGAKPLPDLPRLEGSAIAYSPAFAARAGLRSAPVEQTTLTPAVPVVGTVNFDAEHVAAAGTRIRGFVKRVLKVEGDRVIKGEVLAEIESTELGEAQAQVAVATAKKKAAERNAKREAGLLAANLTTAREEELARAELEEQLAMLAAATHRVTALGGTSSASIGTYFVRAPIGGTVVKRHVAAGQSVESDLVAFRVADLDHLWIELTVFEREIGALRVDDRVELTPTGNTDTKLEGTIAYVGEVIDPETRSAEVRVKVDNSARLLRPGQSVGARIRPSALTRVVPTVPVGAVTYVDGRATVFLVDGDDRVLVREIKLGRSDGVRQEVALGLSVGQRVISDGVFALKSELFR